jgi:hypothetical protein
MTLAFKVLQALVFGVEESQFAEDCIFNGLCLAKQEIQYSHPSDFS